MLQNRSAYFSLDPQHPNRPRAGQGAAAHADRVARRSGDGRLWAVLGCMGADGQPQIHVQAYVAMIDFGLDIQQALDMPRWLSGRFALGEPRDTLQHRSALIRAPPSTSSSAAATRSIAGATGTSSPATRNGITIDPAQRRARGRRRSAQRRAAVEAALARCLRLLLVGGDRLLEVASTGCSRRSRACRAARGAPSPWQALPTMR